MALQKTASSQGLHVPEPMEGWNLPLQEGPIQTSPQTRSPQPDLGLSALEMTVFWHCHLVIKNRPSQTLLPLLHFTQTHSRNASFLQWLGSSFSYSHFLNVCLHYGVPNFSKVIEKSNNFFSCQRIPNPSPIEKTWHHVNILPALTIPFPEFMITSWASRNKI